MLLSTTHMFGQVKGLEDLKNLACKGLPGKKANGMYDQQRGKPKINHEDDGKLQYNGNVCSISIMTS